MTPTAEPKPKRHDDEPDRTRKRRSIKVLNPFYKGATPEDVGRALMRHKPKPRVKRDDDEEPR